MVKKILNNKGVTIVEMMIVIGITVILVGLTGLSLSLLDSGNTTKASTAFKAAVSKAKTVSMSKGTDEGRLWLKKSGSISYKIGGTDADTGGSEYDTIGGNSMRVLYYVGPGVVEGSIHKPLENSAGATELSNGSISLEFNTAGQLVSFNTVTSDEASRRSPVSYANIYQIMFKKSKRVDCIVIYPCTGKIDYVSWYE